MKTVRDILDEHTLNVGRQVTDSYHQKNGLWEGMSIQNAVSLDQALKEIESLLKEAKPEKLVQTKEETDSDWFYGYGYNQGINAYEANLLEKLGGKE